MSSFCSFATQTGIGGMLDSIKPRRGSSAFLALSLHHSSRIPKCMCDLHMWRIQKDPTIRPMVLSSSFLLLHSKTIVGLLYASRRRLSLLFFLNPRVNWFMFVPKSLALPHIQIILQNNTIINKTAGAVLKGISIVICAVPAFDFLNNVLSILFTKTRQGQFHVCATLFIAIHEFWSACLRSTKSKDSNSMLCVREVH